MGKLGEEAVVRYLKSKKFRIIERNFRFLRGEIDIIAYDGKTLVFVEVKARKSQKFGSPEEAVTSWKQRQIKRVAQGFLAQNNLQDTECRFDVLSLSFNEKNGHQIKHLKDAF
ncbi:MAG: YraN family protein [Candidatus Aminicenantes bacterium]|nr:YraN family protein [Candidatus Aminicenantes bacterium]